MTTASFLSHLHWRHAAKSFDTSKKIPEADFEQVLEAVRLAPTSFGIQPFHVHVIEDQATKDRLCAASWNQPQFKTASHVICFVAMTDISARIEEFMQLMSGGDAEARQKLAGYEKMMRGALSGLQDEAASAWSAKQAYIALGFALAACAELRIDSCPMEGFVPAEVDKVLGLSAGLHTCVMLPIGYREASALPRPKVRFPKERLITRQKGS